MTYSSFDEMTKYGGSFLVSLCVTFTKADTNNLQRLKKSFPEVHRAFIQYTRMENPILTLPVIDPFADEERIIE